MAQSKNSQYPLEEQTVSNFFRALGHSARTKILKQLAQLGPSCVQVILEGHPISREAMSNHFKILKDAHLIDDYERFPYTFYMVNELNIALARKEMLAFFDHFETILLEETEEN